MGPPLSSVPFFPAEDSKLRASTLAIRRGGNCPNSLEVLQQLIEDHDETKDGDGTLKPYLVSCLPAKDSSSTKRIIDSFSSDSPQDHQRRRRVDVSYCIYRESHTEAASSYIIRSEQTGSRTLVNYNNLPEMSLREFERVMSAFDPSQETWWHFEVWCVCDCGFGPHRASSSRGRVRRERERDGGGESAPHTKRDRSFPLLCLSSFQLSLAGI